MGLDSLERQGTPLSLRPTSTTVERMDAIPAMLANLRPPLLPSLLPAQVQNSYKGAYSFRNLVLRFHEDPKREPSQPERGASWVEKGSSAF